MKVWCVCGESEHDSANYHRGCYSSLEKAQDAVMTANHDDNLCIIHEVSYVDWELDAPLEDY